MRAGSLAWDLDELPFDLGEGEGGMASEYSSAHGAGWSLAAGLSSQASVMWVGYHRAQHQVMWAGVMGGCSSIAPSCTCKEWILGPSS